MDYTHSLQQFDFSKNESTVYVALLEFGLTNVGPVIQKTGLHRQLVYQALGTLEKKGYVTSMTKNKRQHFQAVSPDAILQHLEEKEGQAKILIPELIKLQKQALDAVEVQTLYGQKGFEANLKQLIESAGRTDRLMRIIGGAKDSDFYGIISNWYREYIVLSKKYQIQKHLIAPKSYAEEFKKRFASEAGSLLRLMSVGLTSPTYTRMTPEMVTIEMYIPDRDVTTIQIRNRAIAQAYIEHFNLLWAQAEEYRGIN